MAHVEITGTGRLSRKLRLLVDATAQLRDDFKSIKAIMDESGASTQDWALLKKRFALSSDADAQLAYTLISAASQKINSADVDQFCNKMG